jgi:hypothetical protein
MQTLISTAKDMARRYNLLDPGLITSELLYDPFYSILLGTAFLARQIERYGPDPILLCAAYNAGSVRKHDENLWHLRVHGPTRMDRYASFFNDFLFAIDHGLIKLDSRIILTRDFLPLDLNS